MMTKIIRHVRAHECEIVRITWTFNDGTTYEQEVRVSPKATRDARTKEND